MSILIYLVNFFFLFLLFIMKNRAAEDKGPNVCSDREGSSEEAKPTGPAFFADTYGVHLAETVAGVLANRKGSSFS